MPTKERTFREAVQRYVQTRSGVTPTYRRTLERILNQIGDRLAEAGLELNVAKMGDREVMAAFETAQGGLSNRRYQADMLRTFLRRNRVVTEPLRTPTPSPERPRIAPEQFVQIHEAALRAGDLRGAAVLLLESLTIRRVGISRLRPEDISPTSVQVLDKGRYGGKPRRIPITPEVWEQLQQYLGWRQREIMRVLAERPEHPIPKRLIIWTHRVRMGDASRTLLDSWVKQCGARCGVNLSHHMMRRMACRELWEATDRPEVAMEISGHSNLKTFLMYVGSMDSQKQALVATMLEKRQTLAKLAEIKA